MTLSRLWVGLAILLPVLGALVARMSAVDLAYHLRAGAEILEARAIPTVDTWTFTVAGQPWTDQQWGAQVILRAVEAIGGWVGLALVRAALVGLIFGGIVWIGLRRGLDARTSALLAIAAFLIAAPALALRPQLLGMACLVGVLALVVIRRDHQRAIWLAPVVIAVWANLHGSFFLGPLVLGLAWLEDVAETRSLAPRMLAVTGLAVLAACLTPFGPMVWAYAISLSANPSVTARITEWQPTSLRDVPGILFFASVLAIVVLIARSGRRVPWPTLAWLGAFFLVGVYAQRGIAWWPLGAATAIAGGILPPAATRRAEPIAMRRLNAGLIAVLIVAMVVALPAWRPRVPDSGLPADLVTAAPPGITATLREMTAPGDHVFQPQPWGSWLEYALPDRRFAVDSRIELFPPDVWARYDDVVLGRGDWLAQLDAWDVDVVVTTAADVGFAERLSAMGWVEVHRDVDGAVFRRG